MIFQAQDPASFGPEIAESTRKAHEIRYTLLPYLYTLFYYHETEGGTVARALWHEYPKDPIALSIDTQFLMGQGLMVSPVLEAGKTSVDVYFPDSRWFDYYQGREVYSRGSTATLPAPLNFINVHLRGGYVYPTQEPALNTEASRLNPLGLIVALDDNERAEGRMYYDDGDSYGNRTFPFKLNLTCCIVRSLEILFGLYRRPGKRTVLPGAPYLRKWNAHKRR